MSSRAVFRPEAASDMARAFAWYQAQRNGLGEEFEQAVHRTLSLLSQMPEAGPLVRATLRRAIVHRFPYAIYYRIADNEIEVRGVLHLRQHPRTWRRRA